MPHTEGLYASEEGGNWRVMAADENGGYTVADMCCDDQAANARLFAAAPKMLDAMMRCYRMLLSEPDTKGALFKAENILREAIAEAATMPPKPEFSGCRRQSAGTKS